MFQTFCGLPIDWSDTGTMLQGIGTVTGAFAVFWAAKKGAQTWKEQKQAERRQQMAEKILTASYKGRNALRRVRSPMLWGYEQTAAEKKLKEDPAFEGKPESFKARLITTQAFYNRLNDAKGDQLTLDECLPMARALFNDDLETAVKGLRDQFWYVQCDVDAYAEDEGSPDAEFTKKIKRGMYDMGTKKEPNEMTQAIDGLVDSIEQLCAPALRFDEKPASANRPRRWLLFNRP